MTVPSDVINGTELFMFMHIWHQTQTLIILPSVNAALDVLRNIEKVIFVLQYDIKYWFLKFTIWHIWYLHYDPFRLLRAFLEKWCVRIKSVCYFNSVLLWWFEVCTVEINYQSQSRQSHGSCYRLENWSVMNIHLPTAISCSSEYSDSSNYPKCWINSNFYMNCWLCLTIRKTPLSDITDQFPNLSTFWFDSLVNFTKCKK